MELRNANSDIMENQNDADCIKNSEAFKKHYATVLVQLKEASGQACGFHGLLFLLVEQSALTLEQLMIDFFFSGF